ncbi:MAG: hypothetical protein GX665_05280 [Gammaproteobacteria bacterium]|nr:hypothetical protein [Gammaproteobacteria bacterium]
MLNFPELPTYRALAAQVYWEPVMGSGECIAAAVVSLDASGQADTHCLLGADVLGLLFRAQAQTASMQLEWVAQSLKRHVQEHESTKGWRSPLAGFKAADLREFVGVNRLDVIDQIASLHASLYKAVPPAAPARPVSVGNAKLIQLVRDAAARRYGLGASKVFTETGEIQIADASGQIKHIELPIQTARQVGSIVSAFSSPKTVEQNLFRAQSNLAVAQVGGRYKAGVFIGRAFASADAEVSCRIDALIDEFHWRFNKVGYHIEVAESPELLAESIMQWAG